MARSYEQILAQIKAQNDASANRDIAAYNALVDADTKAVLAQYDEKIDDTKSEYDSIFDRNEIQRIVDKRQIAENMANLGLTDSGLNRTQQTAAELSYGNRKNSIELQKQNAVNTLKNQLSEYIADANAKKVENELKVRKEYDTSSVNSANEVYNNELKADTERIKLINQTSSKSGSSKSGSSKSTSNKDAAIKSVKEYFKSLYNKNNKGNYKSITKNEICTTVSELEKKFGISQYECMSLLGTAGLSYSEYKSWKQKPLVIEKPKIELPFIIGR